MADIRINALATTATSSSSDDYVAIDGSANGTRKLSAYSPTFGGNLTVNGTGTTSIGGPIKLAVDVWHLTSDSTERLFFSSNSTTYIKGQGTGNPVIIRNSADTAIATFSHGLATTLAGNLIVSGTGTSSVAGSLALGTTSLSGSERLNVTRSGTGYSTIFTNGTSGLGLYHSSAAAWIGTTTNHPIYFFTNGSAEQIVMATTGNLLLGTTTDSANGKLQLATHTTSAGGIGFGTDNWLYRYNANQLVLGNGTGTSSSAIASNVSLRIENNGNGGIQINVPDANVGAVYFGRSSDAYYTGIERSGTNLQLRNAGATALTLDSSQRCILAGALRLNNAYTAGAPTATGYVTIQDSAGNTYKVLVGT